jgi:hypothetical protein
MNTKKLYILGGVFLVLAGLVYWRQAGDTPPPIQEQVKLVPLVPENLTQADVVKLELYSGGAPDERVVLVQDTDDPDVWRIESQFNAPAKADQIEDYIKSIIALKGEPRSREQSDEQLKTYDLTGESAFHVAGYKAGAADPAFTVLVGKSPDPAQVFMRPAGGRDVFVLDVNLRRDAGVYADDTESTPEHGHWLDKQIAAIEMDAIEKVALETPEKQLTFERVEKPVEPEEPAEGEEAAEDPAEPEVEYEWTLASGGPGGEFKQTGLDNWLRAFGSMNATDVADPETPAEWGLESPSFKLALGIEDRDEDLIIEAGRPDAEGNAYVRVSDKEGVVYTLTKYNFERIFPKGTDLFDLPALTVAQETINRIALQQPEGNVVLGKPDEEAEWTVSEPALDLNVQSTAAAGIAAALANWRAADYADAGVDAGLAAPERSVTFSTADGTSHTIALGNESAGIDGAYAKLDDGASVLVMSEPDIDRVFKTPKDFFELTLLDVFDDEIQSIEVDRAEDPFTLNREGGSWTVTVGGETKPAITSVAEDIALAVADFQASNILMGQAAPSGIPAGTITATMIDGATHTFALHAVPDDDSKYELAFSGSPLIFEALAEDVNDLMPASETLIAPAAGIPAETGTPGVAEPMELSEPAAEAAPEAPAPDTGETAEEMPTEADEPAPAETPADSGQPATEEAPVAETDDAADSGEETDSEAGATGEAPEPEDAPAV